MAATYYWLDMGALFHDLRDDPFMSDAKWREWLPFFEDADRLFIKTHPYIKQFTPYADLVRREIDDSPYQEMGSS